MKKLSLLVYSRLQKIAVEKDEDKKVDLIISFYSPGFGAEPGSLMEVGQALLKQSEYKDILIDASTYCYIGFGCRWKNGLRIN